MNRRSFIAALPAVAFVPRLARAGADLVTPILAQTGVTALAGAVVDAHGLVWAGWGGFRKSQGGNRVTGHDRWHLGSNTKPMTAALYGRLVDSGRAKWGATVPELFPDLKVNPYWNDVTVEDLMHHTTGLNPSASDKDYYDNHDWKIAARLDKRPLPLQRTEYATRVFASAPTKPRGTFDYSNSHYILLGAAIERITHTTWEDAIQSLLFNPLGITSAGFGAPPGENPWGHFNGSDPAYQGWDGKGELKPVDPSDPSSFSDNPPALGPAGTVHMSVQDNAKFLHLFLSGGSGVLKPETVGHLMAPYSDGAESYACGWEVQKDQAWSRGPVYSHDGSNLRWFALMTFSPARKIGFIALSNEYYRGGLAAKSLIAKLIEAYAAG